MARNKGESYRRRLRFTREGKYFVALTLGIGFAAINTANNLLYLVFGLMLALIVGSGILSEIALRALAVKRQPPDRLYAKRAFLMGVGLTNGKKKLPSFAIEVEELRNGVPLERKCFFLKVPAGGTQLTSYRHTFGRRGAYRLSGFRVRTRFPFGLFEKSRQITAVDELVVYPEVVPVAGVGAKIWPEFGEQRGARTGRGGEFRSLRDFREGDDPRDISWRKSARIGRIVVREHEDPRTRQVMIYLDNAVRQPSPSALQRQEEAVSRAASLAAHYLSSGHVVALETRSVKIPPAAGARQLDRILASLALLEFVPVDEQAVPPAAMGRQQVLVAPLAEG